MILLATRLEDSVPRSTATIEAGTLGRRPWRRWQHHESEEDGTHCDVKADTIYCFGVFVASSPLCVWSFPFHGVSVLWFV